MEGKSVNSIHHSHAIALGDPNKHIVLNRFDNSWYEEIILGAGITPDDLRFEHAIGNQFLIHIDLLSTNRQTIRVSGLTKNSSLSAIKFNDGTVWNSNDIFEKIIAPFVSFHFNKGDGDKVVGIDFSSLSVPEIICFGKGITLESLSFGLFSPSRLHIYVDSISFGRETICVNDVDLGGEIQQFRFADGTILESHQLIDIARAKKLSYDDSDKPFLVAL